MSTPSAHVPSGHVPSGAAAPEVASLLRSSARGGVWLPVEGVSMLPTISAGSAVRVAYRERAPRLAEIWAFCDESGTVVVHRFRRRESEGRYVFRGDNVAYRDAPVEAERLIGVVTHVRVGVGVRRVALPHRAAWVARRALTRMARYFGRRSK